MSRFSCGILARRCFTRCSSSLVRVRVGVRVRVRVRVRVLGLG